MARVTLRDSRSDASQCEVEVALARLPEALEAALHTDESGAVDATGAAAGGAAGGSGPRVALVLVLGKEAANRMLHHVPKVGRSKSRTCNSACRKSPAILEGCMLSADYHGFSWTIVP